MRKITTPLGNSHSDFDRQLKDLLNDLSDTINNILAEQQSLAENQSKLFQKQHVEILHSSICDVCHRKADIVTTNLSSGQYQSYCNGCLTK
jgi:hypothetical protein